MISTNLPLTIFGDHTRHTKFISFPFIAGADGTQLIKAKDALDDKFFFYLVSWAAGKIGNYGYDRHFKHLKEFHCDYPESKPEQTKIAEILSTVDRAIEQTEALIAKQQRIKTGLMQDLLTRGIDEHGNLRSEKTHQFKDSPLGRVPVEWDHKELGHVAYVTKLAGFEFTNYFDYKAGGEIIALRALNIKNEHLDLSDIQRISKTTSDKLLRSKIFADDILITYIGAYIGDVLRIRENDKYHLAPNIAKVVAGKSLEPSYLEVLLRSSLVQKQIKNLTATTATPSLTMTQIRTLLFAVPRSKDEQTKIAARQHSITVALDTENSKAQKLHRIKTALMQDLLTGKKRVTPLLADTMVTI